MWKAIQDFEERYEVSDSGEVRNKSTQKVLLPKIDKDGYQQIGLRKAGDRKKYWFRIHRLVAMTFLVRPLNYMTMQIDHMDRNPLNNHVSNLRWVTCIENNNNRQDTCWKTNRTTGELYVTKYRNGYMIRIQNAKLHHRSWHKTLEEAIHVRSQLL